MSSLPLSYFAYLFLIGKNTIFLCYRQKMNYLLSINNTYYCENSKIIRMFVNQVMLACTSIGILYIVK